MPFKRASVFLARKMHRLRSMRAKPNHIHIVAEPNPPGEHLCLAGARISSIFVLLLGALGVAGWVMDIESLARPSPWLSPMSMITAVLLCFAAITLWCLAGPAAGRRRWIVDVLGLSILFVGVWSLAGYAWQMHLPFDDWLLDRRLADGLAHGLNRMSPVSAVCFILLGAAASGSSLIPRRGAAAAQAVASAGLLVALVSLVGYLYSIASLVALSDFKPIAPQTAMAFFLSFLGIFLASPDRGVMQTLLSREMGGILARRLLLFVLAIPILLGGIASAGLKMGLLSGTMSIFFLTAATDLSLAGLLLFNAFTINKAELGRRAAQKSLVESERAYRTLFENAADPMFLVDADLVILEANAAAAACLERPASALRGRPMADLAPACAGEVRRELSRAFEIGSASFESCGRTLDGRDVPLEINARSIEVRGRPTVLTIARDLSERRRAERVLAEKDALLRQAQKMEAIGRLAGGIAHDFNNLLTVIMGYSEILLGKLTAADDGHSDAFEIKMCAARAAALTRQLLAFSRRQPSCPRATDMNSVLEEMTPLLGRLIGETIRLEIRREAREPSICIDPTQLEQVILNLAVNARDVMPDGGTLTIESRDRLIDGDALPFSPAPVKGAYVELIVHDTGPGIPEDVEPHIFEPFFTTKSELKGTGLGLSTVYGIVTQNNGAIGVQTSSRTGTTMRVLFPSTPGQDTSAAEAAPQAARGGLAGTVLLVEDDPSVRAYICLGLRRVGYTVLEAGSAEEALQIMAACARPVDIVVSDVVMPGMGGRGLAKALAVSNPGIRILFMTGYDEEGGGGISSLCGRFDLITKPFSVSDLVNKIQEGEQAHAWTAAHAGDTGRELGNATLR
jgi:PAS domain S-box-containing protein